MTPKPWATSGGPGAPFVRVVGDVRGEARAHAGGSTSWWYVVPGLPTIHGSRAASASVTRCRRVSGWSRGTTRSSGSSSSGRWSKRSIGHGRGVGGDDEQREVGLFRQQQVEAAVGFGLDDPHREVGVGVAQLGRGGRQQTAGGGGEPAQRDLPGGFGPRGGQLGPGALPLFLEALRVAQQDAGRVRQAYAAALLHHQVRSDLGGELAQLVGDGGRRVVQRLCRGGHRAVLGDHLEDPEPRINHANSLHGEAQNRLIFFALARPHTGGRG